MKKIVTMLAILLLGIFIGAGAGVMAGIQIERARQEKKETEEKQGAFSDSVTVIPDLTEALSPTVTLESPESPDSNATLYPTAGPTANPDEVPEPTDVVTPGTTTIPSPTATPNPTEAPSPTATPNPTKAPSPTATPESTATPGPKPEPTPDAGTNSTGNADFYGPLHVEGTHLAASDGTLVQLRGISTHGLGWFPDYVNEAMIAQARQEWGCNLFRLAMYTAEYNGYCTSGAGQKENLKNIIDIGVQAAVDQNMYIIIDWHILSDGNPNTYKDEAKKFFAEMAQKYADVPNVIYEICNEPNGGTNWSTIRQYALEIIPVIREHAPEAVIIVGTPTWSQDVDIAANTPITEYDNIMYALHFYAATHKDSLRDKCKTAVAEGLPLFVTEYGICDASGNGGIDEASANKWINLLDSYGISHAMWNLSNKPETSAMIKSSCSKTSNLSESDLSSAGIWFVSMMKEAGLGSEDWIIPESNGTDGSGTGAGTEDSGIGGKEESAANFPAVKDLFEASEDITITISNSWITEMGYGIQLDVVINNPGNEEETDWIREVKLKDGRRFSLSQCWCARVTLEEDVMIIRPEDYNKNVVAGGEVSGIGIILEVE